MCIAGSPSDSSMHSGKPKGGRREGQASEVIGQPNPPGSERWNQWAKQLQILGLTPDQIIATLSPVQRMMNRPPANSDAQLKSLATAILRDTGLTVGQLQQIAMHCPDLLRITNTEALVGNLNWFKVRLGVSMEEWVRLVCSCRPLLLEHKTSLQLRMNELTLLGLERAEVRACWMKNPDILRLRNGALQEKVTQLQVSHSSPGMVRCYTWMYAD